jgi:energy-coupling factor transporter transmembrane protein EcfT
VPMATGTLIFLLWMVTGWRWLVIAGLFTLVVGFGSVLFGAGLLLIRRGPRSWLIGLILLVNFPIAYGIVWRVQTMVVTSSVTVVNKGSSTVESCVVAGGSASIDFGPIRPGGKATRYFLITHDGTSRFTARQNEHQVEAIVEPYVTNGAAIRKQIEIRDGGGIRVQDVPPRAPIVEYLSPYNPR